MHKYRDILIIQDDCYLADKRKFCEKPPEVIWDVDLIISKVDNIIYIHKNRASYQDAILCLNEYFDLNKFSVVEEFGSL